MKNDSDKKIAILAILLVAIIGGGTGVLTKITLKEISPPLFTFLRFLISSLVLFPLLLRGRVRLGRDLGKLILVSFLATGNVLLFAYGIRLTTATISSLLYVLAPIVVAILSYFMLKEKMNVRKSIGVIVGFVGAGLIILLPVIQKSSPFSGNLAGNLLICLAVLSFSLYSVLSKKFQKEFSPIQLTTVFSITTAFLMLILLIGGLGSIGKQIGNLTTIGIFGILYVGILSTAVFYVLYQYAVKHGSPVLASTTLYLQPISTTIWASIVLGERLTPGLIIGGLIVIAGTYLILNSGHKAQT